MKRTILILALAFCLVGCESDDQKKAREAKEVAAVAQQKAAQEKAQAIIMAKIDSLKKDKILNVRLNDTTIDFIMEDGNTITLYSYLTSDDSGGGRITTYYHHLGVK